MKRNFEFDSATVVRWDDRYIDLHNAYDLEHFGTDMTGNEVKLTFSRNRHAINASGVPASVELICNGNLRIAFNNLKAIAAPLDREGIEIAYFNEDCDWLSFLDEALARQREPQGLHISFINGFAVRIFCDEVRFAAQ